MWDVEKKVRYLELPDPSQTWTQPMIVVRDGSWRIYANRDAATHDRPDRVLAIPT
jgi:hypothetical protein